MEMRMSEEDRKILKLIEEGADKDTLFRAIIRSYQRPLYRVIRNMVGTHEAADDVLQNTFMKAFKNIGRFKKESRLYTWLYRIAVNESLNELKKRKRNKVVSLDQNPEVGTEDVDMGQWEVQLQYAIAKLPEKQRTVFMMRYHDDRSYEELSEMLNTSIGGLKANYHHAVQKIKKHFVSVGLLK